MRFAAFTTVIALALPMQAVAHVTVWPKESAQGAREKYAFRMPNERETATVRLEATFPEGVKVSAIEQTPGWTVEARRNAAGDITGAVWTGSLQPGQFVEFGVLAQNPPAASISWSFVQTYEGGERVEWTGPAGSKTPAPQVELRSAEGAAHHH